MSTATKETYCVDSGEDAFVEQLEQGTTRLPIRSSTPGSLRLEEQENLQNDGQQEPSRLELPYAPLDVVKAWLEESGIRGSVQNIHCVRQGLAHILEPEHWAREAE